MGKYRWTYEDDFTCCLEYLKYVFLDEESYDANDLIDKLCEQLPHILPSSIQMKVKNIKQIALESGLEDSVSVTPLYKYSQQCKRAFDDAIEAIRADVEKMDERGNIRGGGPEDEAFLTPPPVDPNRHIFELAILSTIHKKPKLLIDAEVTHKQFGYGRISDVDGKYITVDFAEKSPKFAYPDAFEGFLTLLDKRLQDSMILYSKKMREARERKRRAEADSLISDPTEESIEYLAIEAAVDRQIRRKIGDRSHYGLGYCDIYWAEKKRILKEKYGIEWKSISELNPYVCFD